ncbi:trypsin-like [Harmonia axyridis]|uniref:trypsin-like n=1 Tax=Harmonia axyridis TaxID=115357 RepID=UPI001E279517|nr:trypsin-like [Harmonia axyridis]
MNIDLRFHKIYNLFRQKLSIFQYNSLWFNFFAFVVCLTITMHCCMTILKLLLVKTIISVQVSTTINDLMGPLNKTNIVKTKPNNMVNTSNYYENSIHKEEHNVEVDTRIVGGVKCFVEDYPWMVSIRRSRRLTHYCGGALIAPRWVLSAAHCFESNFKSPWSITAMMGLSTLRRTSAQAIIAKRVFIHEDYDRRTLTNDIALVALEHEVSLYLGAIGFMKIPEKPYISDLSKVCPSQYFMVAGWGSVQAYTNERPSYASSPDLRCVEVPFITNEECVKYSSAASDEKVICTLYKPGGKDACQGDSGGPLFCKGVQYGIVSWGKGCASPTSPGFYTRVDRYLNFINETVNTYVDSSSHLHINFYFFMIMIITVLCC